MTCDRGNDAGAYVLHALEDEELHDYRLHLHACNACRHEVEQLQFAVDSLPMAVPQELPPAVLKDRIMRTVIAEAELLQASGPEADRVPAAKARRERRRFGLPSSLRPAFAAGLASVLVAVGVAGGALMSGDDGPTAPETRLIAGTSQVKGANVALAVTEDRGELRVRGLPSQRSGRVYQVWLQSGENAPKPTHTLFNVRKDGQAEVKISESLAGVDRVLVTAEPDGGSTTPSGAPLVVADTNAA